MARAAVLALVAALAGAGSAAAQSGADRFRLPSGNIYCAYEHYSFSAKNLRCEIRTNGFVMSTPRSYTLREAAPRYGAFKTPSGNIACGYGIAPDGSASMECGIKSGLRPPPRAIHCDAGDPNHKRVALRETGRAVPVICAGDPGPLLPQIDAAAKVLAYGATTRIGRISCASATNGLTCRNHSGHGFFLSRGRWRMF
ncbi:MAG TPA: DUF6636 domain-containing protein [Gaiellaceae bacterium]|nr:DUF6636 domain-containing protein [Gaiellaceae bacterium]